MAFKKRNKGTKRKGRGQTRNGPLTTERRDGDRRVGRGDGCPDQRRPLRGGEHRVMQSRCIPTSHSRSSDDTVLTVLESTFKNLLGKSLQREVGILPPYYNRFLSNVRTSTSVSEQGTEKTVSLPKQPLLVFLPKARQKYLAPGHSGGADGGVVSKEKLLGTDHWPGDHPPVMGPTRHTCPLTCTAWSPGGSFQK